MDHSSEVPLKPICETVGLQREINRAICQKARTVEQKHGPGYKKATIQEWVSVTDQSVYPRSLVAHLASHTLQYDQRVDLQEGLGPGSCQLLLQLSQALSPAEAAAQQVSGVVQVAWGVEGHPLPLVLGLTALLAL